MAHTRFSMSPSSPRRRYHNHTNGGGAGGDSDCRGHKHEHSASGCATGNENIDHSGEEHVEIVDIDVSDLIQDIGEEERQRTTQEEEVAEAVTGTAPPSSECTLNRRRSSSPYSSVVNWVAAATSVIRRSDKSNGDPGFDIDLVDILPRSSGDSDDDNGKNTKKSRSWRKRLRIFVNPMLVRMNRHQNVNGKDLVILGLVLALSVSLLVLGTSSSQVGENATVAANVAVLRRQGGVRLQQSGGYDSKADDELTPSNYRTFADVTEPFRRESDTPVFWHIPKSGGTTIEDILSHCLGLVEASQIGVTHGHDRDESLQVWQHEDGGRYVNVDTTKPAGIQRARELGLAESGLVEVLYTSFLYHVSDALFTPTHRGRMFTLFRHPIERAASMFYYLQSESASLEGTYDPRLAEMSIEEYAVSPQVENNWVTRFLTNKMEGPLGPEHLAMAKSTLRQKCLVGLLSRFEESMERFERYFGWDLETPWLRRCQQNLLDGGDNRNQHPTVPDGSEAWNLLLKQNSYDMRLYSYALQLFTEQEMLGFGN